MRAMISQPMGGLSEAEILAVKRRASQALTRMGYSVVNTYFNDENNSADNPPLYLLGKSLERMADCQAVYFCKGWEQARGCWIEHEAAMAYGLYIMYEGADEYGI